MLTAGRARRIDDSPATLFRGFPLSFGDLTADVAGERFAQAATLDVAGAVAMQRRMMSSFVPSDIMPDARDLPEAIYVDELEARFGGIGGERTDSLLTDIMHRMDQCVLLSLGNR